MRPFHPRSRLKHWEFPGGTVFLTWRLAAPQGPLAPIERDVVLAVITRDQGVVGSIVAGVVMDDHVHALISVAPGVSCQRIAQSWKSISSHALTREFGRSAPVWQRAYFDRWLMEERRIVACAEYILANPRRRWPASVGYGWIIDPRA